MVPRASCPVFMFSAPRHVFGGTEGVGSRFHIFSAMTRFRRYRGRRVQFSCFARPESFSTVPMASGTVFMFCAPELVFGGTEGVGSRFLVLHARLVFGGAEFVGCRFHVLCSRTYFWWYRGRPVPFSCFSLSDIFSAVPGASGLVFMFCAP
jgi:hypothetical protein